MGSGFLFVAMWGNGGKGAESFGIGGWNGVGRVGGWLVTDLGVCPSCGLCSITVRTLRRRNGGTYLRYEVVVWQPESHPGDLAVIVGL